MDGINVNGVLAMRIAEVIEEKIDSAPDSESYEKGFLEGVEWFISHLKTDEAKKNAAIVLSLVEKFDCTWEDLTEERQFMFLNESNLILDAITRGNV